MPAAPPSASPRRVLAVASAGGHWQQLMALRPAYAHQQVTFLTTLPGLPEQYGAAPARIVPDCNRDEPVKALRSLVAILVQVLRVRPHVVITTGALPGVIALALGRLTGARCVWVDSVANAEEFSASGRLARRVAHLRLSQWQGVAEAEGADYAGALL